MSGSAGSRGMVLWQCWKSGAGTVAVLEVWGMVLLAVLEDGMVLLAVLEVEGWYCCQCWKPLVSVYQHLLCSSPPLFSPATVYLHLTSSPATVYQHFVCCLAYQMKIECVYVAISSAVLKQTLMQILRHFRTRS